MSTTMSTTKRKLMALLSARCVAGLLAVSILAGVSPREAVAHEIEYRPHSARVSYVSYERAYSLPRWIRPDRDFARWYRHTVYGHAGYKGGRYADRQLSSRDWHRLYDRYLRDVRRNTRRDTHRSRQANRNHRHKNRHKIRDQHRYSEYRH